METNVIQCMMKCFHWDKHLVKVVFWEFVDGYEE